jgi:hypothetical protein
MMSVAARVAARLIQGVPRSLPKVALTWGFTGAPPGTRTPNPRIKSPLLRNSIHPIYQRLYANMLARYPQSPEVDCRPLTDTTA